MPIRRTGLPSPSKAAALTRRALLRSSVAAAATSGLAVVGTLATPGSPAGEQGQSAGADGTEADPQLREFVLTAGEFEWALMDGVTVSAWGYNDQMPGPEIRLREGDTVRITLRNGLPVPTTIHWHGVNVPPAMDGVAGLNQSPVEPGAEFTYEFVATPAGTRWYHSHTNPALQIPIGLYGSLIIEPKVPATIYDREYTLILAEWDDELTPDVASGKAPRGPRDATLRGGELGADLFLINGKMHSAIPPLLMATGERILLRLIHAGSIPHPIHIHGHSFKIVATDGNPVPVVAQLTKDTVMIGPSERIDLELFGDNPGVWMVHCHIEHHMANGMMTTLWYDGTEPTGPAAAFLQKTPTHHSGHTDEPGGTPTPRPAPEATAAVRPDGVTVQILMLDDRFDPSNISVSAGTTVVWANQGGVWHSVAAFDGSFESGRVAPGQQYSYRFDTPGSYQYICKNHGMQGMFGRLSVT